MPKVLIGCAATASLARVGVDRRGILPPFQSETSVCRNVTKNRSGTVRPTAADNLDRRCYAIGDVRA
jgi:hypothetical protein